MTTGMLTKSSGGALVSAEAKAQLAAALQEANERTPSRGSHDYLSYSGKKDRWTLGQKKAQPDPEVLYIVNPMSFIEGWKAWSGGRPAGERTWSVLQVLQDADHRVGEHELSPVEIKNDGDGWKWCTGFSLYSEEQPDREIKFSTTATGANGSVGDLASAISEQLAKDDPFIPVIKLTSEQFEAHGFTNGKPVFVVEGWVTEQEAQAYIEDVDGDIEDLLSGSYGADEPPAEPEPAKPKGRSKAAKAKEAAPAEEPTEADDDSEPPFNAEPPKRRRRTRA